MKYHYSRIHGNLEKKFLRDIVTEGLRSSKEIFHEIKKTIPENFRIQGFQSVLKVPFTSYGKLIDPILNIGIGNNKTAKVVFNGWFQKNRNAVEKVEKELLKLGYETTNPSFEDDEFEFSLLKPKDIFTDGDKSYFRPNGGMVDGVDENDTVLIALFLGWGVFETKEGAIEADNNESIGKMNANENEIMEKSSKPKIEEVLNEKNAAKAPPSKRLSEQNVDDVENALKTLDDLEKRTKTLGKELTKLLEHISNGFIPKNLEGLENYISLSNDFSDFAEKSLGSLISQNSTFTEIRKKLSKIKVEVERNKKQTESIQKILEKFQSIYRKDKKEDAVLIYLKKKCSDLRRELTFSQSEPLEWYSEFIDGSHYLIKILKLIEDENLNDSLSVDYLIEIEEKILPEHGFDKKESKLFGMNISKKMYTVLENEGAESQKEEPNISPLQDTAKSSEPTSDQMLTEEAKKHPPTVDEEVESFAAESIGNSTETDTQTVEEVQAEKNERNEQKKEIEGETESKNEKEEDETRTDQKPAEIEIEIKEKKLIQEVEKRKGDQIEKPQGFGIESQLSVSDLNEILFDLLEQNELALAFHLSKCLEKSNMKPVIPSLILESYILSSNITVSSGLIKERLHKNFLQIADDFSGKKTSFLENLFLLAATLRPTLIALGTTIAEDLLLETKVEGLQTVNKLKKEISDFGTQLKSGLDYEKIYLKFKNSSQTDNEKDLLIQKLEEWPSRSVIRKSRHPIISTWLNWIKNDGFIGKELNSFCETKNYSVLEGLFDNKLKDGKWQKLFEDHFKSSMKKKKIVKDGPFYRQISGYVDDLSEIIIRLVEISKKETKGAEQPIDLEIQRFFERVSTLITESINELDEFDIDQKSCTVKSYAIKSLEKLRKLLNNQDEIDSTDVRELLYQPLLKLDFYESETDGRPIEYGEELLNLIVKYSKENDKSIEAILNRHAKNYNFESLSRLVSLTGRPFHDFYNDRKSNEVKAKIDHEKRQCEISIDNAFYKGYFNEDQRLRLISDLEAYLDKAEVSYEYPNLPLINNAIGRIIKRIDNLKQSELKSRKDEIDKVNESGIRKSLIELLEKEDVRNFDDYKDRVMKGEIVNYQKSNNQFDHFFNTFLENCSKAGIDQVRTAISDEKSTPFYEGNLSDLQKKESLEMIESWQILKFWNRSEGNENIQKRLKVIIETIGFKVQEFGNNERSTNKHFFDVTCSPIQNKDICPIPHYGSSSNGKYRFICMWGVSNEEDLIQEVKTLIPSTGRSVIVLSFVRINAHQRINFGQYCKRSTINFILLDELALFYLSLTSGSRLPIFFKLTLPFTYQLPYQTDASNLPVEMFYGRKEEIHQIRNISGKISCFIYGGRQLGKTVLLREVKRLVDRPDENSFGVYIDLKSKGIGHERPIDDFASVLFEELQKTIPQVFSKKNVSKISKVETLLEYIRTFLFDNSEARILLFLDEADNFLELDTNNDFIYTNKLKGLMEETEKRFKLIFSGLHNVMRSTKAPNHPLAHLGEPICIGPLKVGSDTREAELLVKAPFESLGFSFESNDLVLSILSFCNWYPSLIQIVCSELLSHMYRINLQKKMPVIIENHHVNEAKRKSLNRVKEKFALTLGLDERYDLLANIISLETIENPAFRIDGVDLNEITIEAIDYWNEGFDSTNPNIEVENLLSEMVDLGILRLVFPKRYAMRTPNLINLIGSKDQIEDNIQKGRVKQVSFMPAISRLRFRPKNTSRESKSSLTGEQFSKLKDENGKVSLILGSKMLGIDKIKPFLEITDSIKIHDYSLNRHLPVPDFAANITKDTEKSNLIVIDNFEVSDEEIVNTYKRIKPKTNVNAVFLFRPEDVYNKIMKGSGFGFLENEGISIISLRKWDETMIREWYRDTGCISPKIDEIIKVTGKWHALVDLFHDRIYQKSEGWKDEIERFERELKNQVKDHIPNFGLINNELLLITKNLIDLGEVSLKEFIEIVDGMGENQVTKLIECLRRLSIIDNHLLVDPIIANMLKND
jgi:hypothetical protein